LAIPALAGLLVLPRDGMHKVALCRRRRPVSVCPSVRLSVTFVYSVEASKHIFKMFSLSGSHAVLVFPYQTLRQYSDGDPPNWGKNRDFGPIYGFGIDDCWTVECRQHFDSGVRYSTKKLSCRRETALRFVSLNILLSHSIRVTQSHSK